MRHELPPARDAIKEMEQLLLATSILIRMTTKTSACCAAIQDPSYTSPPSSGSRVSSSGAMACSARALPSPPPLPPGCVSCDHGGQQGREGPRLEVPARQLAGGC